MLPILLMLAAPDADGLVMAARSRLAAEQRCIVDPDTTDITICGLRRADRLRVPFIVHDAGDPRHEGVPAERLRLLHRTTPIQDLSPVLVGGGMVGVSTTVGSDGRVTTRAPAP